MLDVTTVMRFCQLSMPQTNGQALKSSVMTSLTLSRVRTYVTEASPHANRVFKIMSPKITMWKVQKI